MISPSMAESRLRDLGVIRHEEFLTATDSIPANQKVEMSVMYRDPELTENIAELLAVRLESYEPEIIVPVPRGANRLGMVLGNIMGLKCLIIKWTDKPHGQLGYFGEVTRARASRTKRIALIEDVSTTDGTMALVAGFLGPDKDYAGGVVWDRDPQAPKRTNFPVERIIESHVPFRTEK